jgi:thiosulfate reductase cytochrome b subunit
MIRKVCMIPLMLITGLCFHPATAVPLVETVVGGIASPRTMWGSPECQERSA